MKKAHWVEGSCSRWYILSAKHGLVAPGEVLHPYDETLTTKGSRDRRTWAYRVLAQLRDALSTPSSTFTRVRPALFKSAAVTAAVAGKGPVS
jgi:Family of unknown function (DUF6884)